MLPDGIIVTMSGRTEEEGEEMTVRGSSVTRKSKEQKKNTQHIIIHNLYFAVHLHPDSTRKNSSKYHPSSHPTSFSHLIPLTEFGIKINVYIRTYGRFQGQDRKVIVGWDRRVDAFDASRRCLNTL